MACMYRPCEPSIRESFFGTKHPAVGSALNDLGVLLQQLGQFAPAQDFLQRGLAILEYRSLILTEGRTEPWRRQQLSTDHPKVATALSSLGSVLYRRQQYSKAKALLSRALMIRERVLGSDHRLTKATREALAKASAKLDQKRSGVPGNAMRIASSLAIPMDPSL